MNTLQDLRATLDRHAADVGDDLATARVAAVAGRARVVRRRRAAGFGAAVVVVLVAAVALSAVPTDRDLAPARAPESFTSLGWSYRLDGTVRADSGQVGEELGRSELPRLVSWSTTGDDQQVVVRLGGESWTSAAGDFDDFVWVPPNFAGRVTVSGEPGLTMATYALDESVTPAGVGAGVSLFREEVAGRELAGAAVGEPGQAELVVPVDAGRGFLSLAHTCEGLPSGGYRVRIGVVGQPGYVSSGASCAVGSGFDPGGSPDIGIPGSWGPGAALRIWVTRGGETVADGALPDLRLGLAAYVLADEPVVVARHPFPRVIEHRGHVWQLEEALEGGDGRLPRAVVPQEGQYVVSTWLVADRQLSYAVSVDGSAGDQVQMSGTDGSGSGAIDVGPGQEVALDVRDAAAVERAALVLYRRVD